MIDPCESSTFILTLASLTDRRSLVNPRNLILLKDTCLPKIPHLTFKNHSPYPLFRQYNITTESEANTNLGAKWTNGYIHVKPLLPLKKKRPKVIQLYMTKTKGKKTHKHS